MKKINKGTGIFIIENFLSSTECDQLIIDSEMMGYEDAKVNIDGQQKMLTMVRNNQRILHVNQELADLYWGKLKPFCSDSIGNSDPLGLNEMFRFYKYTVHQRFKKHRDGSYIRNDREYSLQTFMIYLNDEFEGGNTLFEEVNIRPKKGDLLVFKHELKHEGQKIVSGTKYVLRTDVMYRLNANL